MKKIFNVLFAVVFSFSLVSLNTYAEDETIHIKSVTDWQNIAKEFELDEASANKKVVLDNDLIFDNNFVPIPYFQGEFDGQGHKLSGVELKNDQKYTGIFRLTGFESDISNLTVSLVIDSYSENAGFVGYNQGKITDVEVEIQTNGNDILGGIAGYNAVSGYIENCVCTGEAYGEHYVGGIVGENYGFIKSCDNYASINNRVDDDNLDIKNLTIEALLQSENAATITDLGGIAGQNYGTIKNCNNYGLIGYNHVGYNVGGIAGTSLGCIENSFNNGKVYGRKEIGGIVGQMEPAMQLDFYEDYPTKLKRQITNLNKEVSKTIEHATDYGHENADALYTISDDLREAYDSLELMMKEGYVLSDGKLTHTEAYDHYRTALSASLSDVFDTFDDITTSQSDITNDLGDDFNDISSMLKDLGNTTVDAADSVINPKDMYRDVSDFDDDALKEGKVIECVNNGNVYGDINVGGIAGSMAKENNADPEDDFSIVGETSLNGTYKIKAVINKCKNQGRISIKRNNAGGIAGNQDLGLIKNSINYGLLECSDGKFVGGIVGKSISTIKNNFAKCFIYGDEYVGGIAGAGLKLEDNGSLAQIVEANANYGSVMGNYINSSSNLVENEEGIKNNWYIYDLAAIDGISYSSKAYKITNEEMLEKDLDEGLKKVNVYFFDDDLLLSMYTIDYGESLSEDKIPLFDQKELDYGIWTNLKEDSLKNINKDLLFKAEYNNILPSISSLEEPKPYIVVEGEFVKGDTLETIELENTIVSSENITFKPVYEISDHSSINKVRLYTNSYKNYDVYEYINENWQKINYEVDGSYAVCSYDVDACGYSIVKTVDYTPYIVAATIGVTLTVLANVIYIKNKRKNKK